MRLMRHSMVQPWSRLRWAVIAILGGTLTVGGVYSAEFGPTNVTLQDKNEVTTLNIIDAAANPPDPECLEYCITGVCSFLDCDCNLDDGCNCKLKFGPLVEHFNPDLVVSVYTLGSDDDGETVRNNPWSDLNSLIAPVQNSISDSFIKKLLKKMTSGGVPDAGLGTGQRTAAKPRRVQLIQKEVDAFGHPMASLMEHIGVSYTWGENGGWGPAQNSSVNDEQAEASAADWASSLSAANDKTSTQDYAAANASVGGSSSDVSTYADYAQFAATWGSIINPYVADLGKAAKEYKKVADAVDTVAAAFDAASAWQKMQDYAVSISINFFCPSAATSFYPYYTSVLDPVAWRFAIPERLYPEAFLPPVPNAPYTREVGQAPYGFGLGGHTWGAVYPRAGFIGSYDDRTSAAVFAQRAADFITRESQPHVYLPLQSPQKKRWRTWPATEANPDVTRWQELSPVRRSCEAFGMQPYWPYASIGESLAAPGQAIQATAKNPQPGADTSITAHNSTASYLYVLWRKYRCCAAVGGTFIAQITGNKYCLN